MKEKVKQKLTCQWCGQKHQGQACPLVKEIEYYPGGEVKRVVFWTELGQRKESPQPKILEG